MSGTILLIGQSAEYAGRMRAVLHQIGCHVTLISLSSPQEVSDYLRMQPAPSLVLLDVELLGASSLDTFAAIRDQECLRWVPIVLLAKQENAGQDRFSRLGSATLLKLDDEHAFREQVERLAERFLNDWIAARPSPRPGP